MYVKWCVHLLGSSEITVKLQWTQRKTSATYLAEGRMREFLEAEVVLLTILSLREVLLTPQDTCRCGRTNAHTITNKNDHVLSSVRVQVLSFQGCTKSKVELTGTILSNMGRWLCIGSMLGQQMIRTNDPGYQVMFRIRPSELYILSCEKGRGTANM